jgi:hypothetical protein
MKKQKVRKIERYLNPVAQIHLLNTAPYKTLIAGRGFSKSFTNGLEVADKVARMPGSCGLFNSPSYNMIYTKTLIPMKAAWEQHMGYIEDIHYVVGKTPPKYFGRPYHRPQKFENVVTFWNGTTIVFGTFDRPQTISGGSYDWVITDEAYMIDKDEYDQYVIPAIRPTHPKFKGIEKHLQQSFTSSMPYKGQGEWLLDFLAKSKTNPEGYGFTGWEPNAKVQMGSTWMNRVVHGDKTILQWQMEMEKNNYRVMVLNQKVTNFGATFYPLLGPKHWYIPKANKFIDYIPLNETSTFKRDARFDQSLEDYDPDLPLHISHDWGKFNCIVIDQEHPKEVRIIKAMHVHNPKTIDDLADDFAEYYRKHKAKLVYQWGDKSGTNRQANSKLNYFEQFAERLRDKGWRVVLKKTGDVEHLERHRFIAKLHGEEDKRLPIIRHNANNCPELRIALESAGMKGDKKDKSSENNPSIKPEHATHYTDAYDYRLYHGLKHRETNESGDYLSTSLNT